MSRLNFSARKIKFNGQQLDRLSEFSANMALVFFGSMVIPVFFTNKRTEILDILIGLLFTIGALITSLHILKNKNAK